MKRTFCLFLSIVLPLFVGCSGTSNVQKYVVQWLNYDNSILDTETYIKDEMPEYKGDLPVKPSTNYYEYSFAGWNNKVIPVTQNTSYIATFSETERIYNVVWKNYDGTILKSGNYKYNDFAYYDGLYPEKEEDNESYYCFDGWYSETDDEYYYDGFSVTHSNTLIASFSSETRYYTITWLNDDNQILTTEQYTFGSMPNYSSIPISSKQHGSNNTFYAFVGWTPKIEHVSCDTSYTAIYKEHIYKTKVTWKNIDDSILDIEYYDSDENISYKGATPVYPYESYYKYTFSNWSTKSISSNEIEKTAYYSRSYSHIYYNYTFLDYDDTVISEQKIDHWYESISIPYDKVTKKYFDDSFAYNYLMFVDSDGYTPDDYSRRDIRKNAIFRPVYSKAKKISVTWKNYDGQVLSVEYYGEGDIPSYSGKEPFKPGFENGCVYRCFGWDKPLEHLKNDMEYFAIFEWSNDYFNIKNDICYGFVHEEYAEYFDEIVIPDGVKTIYDNAFSGLSNIKHVKFSDSVNKIGASAFQGCSSLQEVDIKNATLILNYAFSGCESVESIYLPNLTGCGRCAFWGCWQVEEITVNSDTTYYRDYDSSNISYNTNYCKSNVMLFGLSGTGHSMPQGPYHWDTFGVGNYDSQLVNKITVYTYIYSSTQYITYECYIPNSIKIVNFTGNNLISLTGFLGLEKASFDENINTIYEKCFYGCKFTSYYNIPNDYVSIEEMAFCNCQSLQFIYIPKSIISIENSAFYYCNALKKVFYGGSENKWSEISIGNNNECLINASRYYYSETEPTTIGNYWHFVNGEPVEW